MSAELWGKELFCTLFLSALLLPHHSSAALSPHPASTSLPVTAAAAALTFSSSSFRLCRFSRFFFCPLSHLSRLSERLLVGKGQLRSNSTSSPGQTTSDGSAAAQEGVQAEDWGHRSATQQEKTTLQKSCAIRQPLLLVSTGFWFWFVLTLVRVVVQHQIYHISSGSLQSWRGLQEAAPVR